MSERSGPAGMEGCASIDVRGKRTDLIASTLIALNVATTGDGGGGKESFFLCRNLTLCSQPRASFEPRWHSVSLVGIRVELGDWKTGDLTAMEGCASRWGGGLSRLRLR